MLALHEKYIVDEKGRKTATILPYAEWKKVAAILEEYADICAYDKAKARLSNSISFEKAKKLIKSTHP